MAPVAGRPFLEFLMDYWITQGIRRFVLSIGYLGETIWTHFGNHYRECAVEYSNELTPLGTGGGIRQALLNTTWQQDYVLLINGDTWYEVSLEQLTRDAQASDVPITIALKPMKSNPRYGAVRIDANRRVKEFGARTNGECLVNGGCYLIETDSVGKALAAYPDRFSLEQEFLVPMAKAGQIGASIQNVEFLDIGNPADYYQAADVIGRSDI